ncbi:MAG: LptF/LptG family permease [Candidatus Brocadiia bacterium]
MLGRRLDRYVTAYFLWHFALALIAILGLYIVVETFSKLDEFVEHRSFATQVRWIATYHLYQIPVLVSQYLPIVTIIAGVIALARLARYNELNAMKAAGVSMQRTMLPILLCSLAIGAICAADQEFLIPYLEDDIRYVRYEALKSDETEESLFSYDAENQTTIYVQELDNAAYGYALEDLQATSDDPARPDFALRATHAIWVGQCIYLFNVRLGQPEDQEGEPDLRYKTLISDGNVDRFNPAETPYAIRARLDHLDGKPVNIDLEVAFRAAEYVPRFHVIHNAQLAKPFVDERTAPAPINVETAVWYKKRWHARAQSYKQLSDTRRDLILYDGEPLGLAKTPQQLVRERDDPSLKSFAALLRLAEQLPRTRQKLMVIVHSRVAFPFASFVLLLVTIPFLFQQEGGKSTWVGVGLALLVSVGFYFVNYTFQLMGHNPEGPFGNAPALAAWLPLLLFGAAGALLFTRMDT